MPAVSFRIVTSADHARRPVRGARERRRSRRTSRSRRCGGGSAKRVSSRCPCGRTATRARPRCSCRRWRSESRWSSRAHRRSPPATGSSTARTAASWHRVTKPASSERSAGVLGDEFHARALGLERQGHGRAGAHVGAVRGSDRGASSRRSLSTAAISVGISLNPTGSRCAARSAAVHGAHSCISTKSSLTTAHASGRRSEHDRALLALGVHLHDHARGRSPGAAAVSSRMSAMASTRHCLGADLVLRPGVRRVQRVRPGPRHHAQHRLAALRSDGGRTGSASRRPARGTSPRRARGARDSPSRARTR